MATNQYYKKRLIKAEQFDGSRKMAERYHMLVWVMTADTELWKIDTLEGHLLVKTGDWIATGSNGEHWPIKDDIFRKTYVELPAIPQKVADYIQKAKSGTWGIIDCYYHVADNVTACGLDGVRDWEHWIVDHQDAFARAWLGGYRIEEDEHEES
jgi:hypothetical protein